MHGKDEIRRDTSLKFKRKNTSSVCEFILVLILS